MKYSQESKSQLAKLLATENLTIEHRKMATAMFDLKSRILYCPIWENMSGELYDLLLGHEVGHALETPAEGWHNAVPAPGVKDKKNFKSFLNVVEDARIEKKIKRRFPGLRQSFVKAYGELIERDFFGTKNRDIKTMPFIDRLNMYTKGGISLGITFSPDEQILLNDVESCETWEDVVRVANAVYDYSKKELENMDLQMPTMEDLDISFDDLDGDDVEFDTDDGSGQEQDSEDEGSKSEKTDKEKAEPKEEESEPSNTKGDKEESGKQVQKIEREKESKAISGMQVDSDPVCETDDNFRRNEHQLLSKDNKTYVYANIPTPVMSEILTGYKRVHEQLEHAWSIADNEHQAQKRENTYKTFKDKNERYVSLLAKEFEMRKAASKFAKNKVSETGDIDVNRIYKYQIDDNIFKKIMRIPKGKSHGLVLMFDRSGSMQPHMSSTIEQIMILSMFCRKVNIPFVVYGFGNETTAFRIDHNRTARQSFTIYPDELYLDNVFLREYLNSKMSVADFNRCMKNLACLADCYTGRHNRKFTAPPSECLSNTPMIEAMIALKSLTVDFRKINNLDIVNTVILHDGDADSVCYMMGKSNACVRINANYQNVVLRDKKNKLEYVCNSKVGETEMRKEIFDWYRDVTGSKIIGFYIAGSGNSARSAIARRYMKDGKTIDEMITGKGHSHETYYERKNFSTDLAKKLKEEKFLESGNLGYNKFFFLPGDAELTIEDESLQIDGQVTAGKLKNAFMKMNKKRQVSRVLVNRFIGEIAV